LLFTATIGPHFDETVKDLTRKNRMSEACILDSLGSVAVENMVQQFHAQYDSHLNLTGKSATLPFSPGYCDWNISEQKKIFGMVDAERIGVSINESALMEPRKSISGVFGLQNSVGSSGKPYNPCMYCTKVDCSYKRAV
jgi:cobalamin-dependent methionine synthase I